MACLGLNGRVEIGTQFGSRARCEGDDGSVVDQVTTQGFCMRCAKRFRGQISPSFPLEEGLIGINQLLASERAEVVAAEGRESWWGRL